MASVPRRGRLVDSAGDLDLTHPHASVELVGGGSTAGTSEVVENVDESPRGMDLLTPAEAARIVRLSPVTLRNMRSERRGPAPTYMGRRVYYLRRALYAWLDAEAKRQAEEWAAS